MEIVIHQYAQRLGATFEGEAIRILAQRSNGMPRNGVSLFRRATDYQVALSQPSVNVAVVEAMLKALGIDQHGLDRTMIAYLKVLAASPTGKLALNAISAMIGTDEASLLFCVEPPLMKRCLICRSSAGRELTEAGRALMLGGDGREKHPFYMRLVS